MAEISNAKAQVLVVLVAICCALDGVIGLCIVEHCTDGARCEKSKDGLRCKCTRGHYGDLCDRNATISVLCGKDSISIKMVEEYFQYYKIPLESLRLRNSSCRLHREVISDVPYYVSQITKDQYLTCGGKPLEKNFTHITFNLVLMSLPQVQGKIIREPTIKIEFSCVYPYIRTISLPYPIIPLSSETVMRVGEQDAKVEMLLYKDHTYAEPYRTPPSVQLRDKVYVEVKVTRPKNFFHLRVDKCWANQSPQHNGTDATAHPLLLNGCAEDETVTFLNTTLVQIGRNEDSSALVPTGRNRDGSTLVQTGRNGDGSTIRYSFDMFRFVVEPHDLYLHCEVRLCAPDDSEPCIPECRITKRAAVHSDSPRGMLSYGPIRFEIPETKTSKSLVTMVLPVAGIWVLGLFLLLLITIAKAGNRRLALRNPH